MSRRAGLIVAALAACSPLLIWYSQEARSYELLALLTERLAARVRVRRADAAPRVLAAWVIACALALATHYYAALVVVPEAIWLLVYRTADRRPVQVAFAVVARVRPGPDPAGDLPAVDRDAPTGSRTQPFGRRLGQVIPQFAAGFGGPAHSVLEPVAIAIVVLALVLLATRSDAEPRRGALLAGGIALAGLLISLALVVVGFDDLLTRNLLAVWAPAAVLVAGGLAAPRPRGLGLLATAVLCAIGVSHRGRGGVRSRPGAPRLAGGGRRARHACAGRRAGHPGPALPRPPAALAVRAGPGVLARAAAGGRGSRSAKLDVVSFTSPRSAGFCWWGSACNLWPSRMQALVPVAGFQPGRPSAHALQFTILRMVVRGRCA